jgi:U2 small nuclear ribonucleoprotein A'
MWGKAVLLIHCILHFHIFFRVTLRGLKIPVIENLGALKDAHDVIDLSDNVIRKFGGFPLCTRLSTLFLANNNISQIEPNLVEHLPKLQNLILSNNKIDDFNVLESLLQMPLLRLALAGNPIGAREDYRLRVIHLFPKLKLLDFEKVTQKVFKFLYLIF